MLQMVANRRSKSKRVMGTAARGSRMASRASGVETRLLGAGTAAGEEIVAGVTIRPPLSCVREPANSGTMSRVGSRGWGQGGRGMGAGGSKMST